MTLLALANFEAQGVPVPEAEYRFHPSRKWRFDYCWPDALLALEIEGGVWTGGRHTRPKGFLKDMEKYNQAAILGWRVLRCTPEGLYKVSTARLIKHALKWAQLRTEMNLWAGQTAKE